MVAPHSPRDFLPDPPSPAPSASPLARLLRAARRAGVAGSWYGGAGGSPDLALSVGVPRAGDLPGVLEALAGAGMRATLVLALDRMDPADLRAATLAGHELAGSGLLPRTLAGLDLCAAQSVRLWEVEGLGVRDLLRLPRLGLRALPPAAQKPIPGLRLHVPPAGLSATLERLRALGYRPLPLRELPGLREATWNDLLLHLYTRAVEDPFTRRSGVVEPSARADAVMRVVPTRTPPAPLPLPPGTPTAELHLDSARIVALSARSPLAAYRATQRSLRDVARALTEVPELQGARAVFAVSLLVSPLEGMGFTLLDLPPLRAWWYGLGFRLLRRLHGTRQASSAGRPRLAWMPREAFLERYGEGPTAGKG